MDANSESLNPPNKPMAMGGDKPFLHIDIIINILKRLPVKSILRFRSVCKDWKNLFKTQSFIAEHARHSAHESPFLILQEYDSSSKRFSLRLLNQKMETVEVPSIPSNDFFNHDWRITGSCNGLLYLECWRPFYWVCLWNPANREVREITQTRKDNLGHSVFGFGFSSIVNDYKIVRFSHARDMVEGRAVKVYSLSTDSWKELEPRAVPKTGLLCRIGTFGVSVDGTMACLGYDDSFGLLVTFDMVTEEFTSTPIPPIPSVVRVPPTTLGVCQNKFVISRLHPESHFMDILVMEQVASESGKHFSCSEKYSVEVPFYVSVWDIFCIWGNEIVCYDNDRQIRPDGELDCNLKLFNLTTKEWKDSPYISSPLDCLGGVSYAGSLMSLYNPQVP